MPQAAPLVFLSHSGADTEAARTLKLRLEAAPEAQKASLKVWFDKDDLRPGTPWSAQIAQTIQTHATAFVVYVGSGGVMNWVEAEVELAISRATTGKPRPLLFIPALAAESKGSGALPPFAKRYQGVRDPLVDRDELGKLLAAVLDLDYKTTPILIDEPFVGLRAMREEESDRFFGRKAEIAELTEKFRKHRIVAVVADGGTGKSSLARAGFAPAFRGGALIETAREEARDKIWQVVTMRPRADPAEGLRQGVEIAAQKLGRSLADVASLRDRVSIADAGKTAFALRCGLPPDRTSTLLIVDQFEELFTTASDQDAAAFAALLLALAGCPSDIRILLTVRSDYFNLATDIKDAAGRPALFERLTADNNDGILRLKAMSPAGLREAVLEPLKLAGETNETALADAVETDISHQASDLPLLQVALRAAWQRHRPQGLTMLECYQSVGRVSGALADEAKLVLQRLLPDDRGRLESIFVRLVRLGDTGGATRLGASLDDFDPPRRALLQKLGEDEYGRLISVGATHAELAHEALITQWPWLQGMLKANVADVRPLARLMERAKEWRAAPDHKKDGYLATGAERELFGALAKRRADWLSKADRDFVAASEKAFQDDVTAKKVEAEQRQHERDAEQARKLADARTIARRTAIGAGVAIVLAIAACAFGSYAEAERKIADHNAEEAVKNAKEAIKQRDVANRALIQTQQALGRSIWANFDFNAPVFSLAEIDGLWDVAKSSGAERDGFVQPLKDGDRSIVAKFARRPDFIMRSLGLSHRSPDTILTAIAATNDLSLLQALARAVQALPVALTPEQAQAALQTILTAIGATNNPNQLQALARAVQALPVALTPEQAQAALQPVLTAIGATKDPFQLQAFAQAVQALAGKLPAEQAQMALQTILTAVAATKDPVQLQTLAQAVQALRVALSAEQVQAALQPVLTAIGAAKDPYQLQALTQVVQALAGKLSAEQALAALQPILTAIAATKDQFSFRPSRRRSRRCRLPSPPSRRRRPCNRS